MAKNNATAPDKILQMHNPAMAGPKVSKAQSTQRYLDIAEVRDGTIVLRDGGVRAILMVSSMNFALKSQEEQEAIVYGYQAFLNSIDFPVQIVIQSRILNIRPYLEMLEEREKTQLNELLRIQTQQYREYIQQLIDISNIMEKSFYVTIPFHPLESKEENFASRFTKIFSPTKVISTSRREFDERRRQLLERVERVVVGLNTLGLKSIVLNTSELIELVYTTYNPEITGQENLADIKDLAIDHGE
ncbi:MAG: hypothetical protein Q8P33_00270 [bacterium]|nr:hypothetical protein [bacterium]